MPHESPRLWTVSNANVGHLRIACRKLLVLTVVGPIEPLNLFIFLGIARVAGRERD